MEDAKGFRIIQPLATMPALYSTPKNAFDEEDKTSSERPDGMTTIVISGE